MRSMLSVDATPGYTPELRASPYHVIPSRTRGGISACIGFVLVDIRDLLEHYWNITTEWFVLQSVWSKMFMYPELTLPDDPADLSSRNTLAEERPHREGVDDSHFRYADEPLEELVAAQESPSRV